MDVNLLRGSDLDNADNALINNASTYEKATHNV